MNSHDDATESRFPSWGFVAIWLGLAAIFVGVHYDFFFFQPHTEIGDFAANALQIRKAKFFQELYGNYSRFGFHHPGPGFFYLYAMGEWVFFDFLKVVPSEFNAHIITGILIQCGLFTWSLAVLYRQVGRRAVVAVLLLLAAIHFGLVNYLVGPETAFITIWPPNVLIFPFVCFVAASASVASGAVRDILPAVISACLLAHGHVAQPLFVAPLFLLAIIGLFWHCRSRSIPITEALRAHKMALGVSLVILALALFPLLLDVAKGANSNLNLILADLSARRPERKTVAQAILYLAHFSAYEGNPEKYCDSLGSHSLDSLKEHWYFVTGWLLVFGASLFLFIRNPIAAKFERWLTTFVIFGLCLSVVWGMLQAGPMLAFNSFFNYGLMFLLLASVVLPLCRRLDQRGERLLAISSLVIAIPLFAGTAKGWRFASELPGLVSNSTVMPELPRAAQASPSRIKYLLFERADWGWAAGVAIALQRNSFDFAVPPQTALEFGLTHAMDPQRAVEKGLPVWRFGPAVESARGFRVRADGPTVTTERQRDPTDFDIVFAGEGRNAQAYTLQGWDLSGELFAWSISDSAVLYMQPAETTGDVVMSVDLIPAILPGVPSQRVEVSFNDTVRERYVLSQESTVTMRISALDWNQNRVIVVRFAFPDAKSPLEAGSSSDPRKLGCAFRRISFRHLSPVPGQ